MYRTDSGETVVFCGGLHMARWWCHRHPVAKGGRAQRIDELRIVRFTDICKTNGS